MTLPWDMQCSFVPRWVTPHPGAALPPHPVTWSASGLRRPAGAGRFEPELAKWKSEALAHPNKRKFRNLPRKSQNRRFPIERLRRETLHGKPVGGDRRPPPSTPDLQRYYGRGLSEVLPKVTETRADQSYGCPEFVRLDLHVLGPMVNLKIARGVDQDRRVWDRFLHRRYSTMFAV